MRSTLGVHLCSWRLTRAGIEITELLLEKGANVRTGYVTPLHRAASHGHKEIDSNMLNADADGNTTRLGQPQTIPQPSTLLRKHGGKTGEELKAEDK